MILSPASSLVFVAGQFPMYGGPAMDQVDVGVAYLAEGKLYLKPPGQEPRLIESQFAEQSAERAQRSVERNAWKSRETSGMLPSALLWQQGQRDPTARRMHIVGITRGAGGKLLYSLDTEITGGLFAHDPSDGSEQRLFHRNKFRARDLSRHAFSDVVALSLRKDDGTANIAVTNSDGRNIREITEGDSIDESPHWAPGERQRLVFQSAGVGRNKAGHVMALGPYAIEELDLDGGGMKTLMDDGAFDHLCPQVAPDGALWFIRRPYKPSGHGEFSVWKAALDALLFPFRLARAFVHFFNFFSLMFAQKPLLTAGGPPRPEQSTKQLLLWGKMIDADKAMKAAKEGSTVSLVPRSWQLIRRVGEQETVVAEGVLSFDFLSDGGVVYANGTTVYHRPAGGSTEAKALCTGRLIDTVIATGS